MPQQRLIQARRHFRRREMPTEIMFVAIDLKASKQIPPQGPASSRVPCRRIAIIASPSRLIRGLVAGKYQGTHALGYLMVLSSSLNRRIIVIWPKLRRKGTTDADTRRERVGDPDRTG